MSNSNIKIRNSVWYNVFGFIILIILLFSVLSVDAGKDENEVNTIYNVNFKNEF